MSLDKGIQHGKEHREPYYRSGRFDVTCRPHGGSNPSQQCNYCKNNRLLYRRKFTELVKINVADL